jgi:hypothetical protein
MYIYIYIYIYVERVSFSLLYVKLSLCCAVKIYGVVEVEIHVILTLALDGSEWAASSPVPFCPGERAPSIYWTGDWLGPRDGLGPVEKTLALSGIEHGPPACSPS